MQRQGSRVTEKSPRRQHDSEQEIDDLVARFDDLLLPKREWTHFAHLTVGFCSLERFGLTASRLLPPRTPRLAAINLLIEDPLGAKDLPLAFYSRDQLMSVAARRAYVEPDLQPIEALETIESAAMRVEPFT
jgi:hypothetical protein